jgi:hypothetical protein
MLRYSEMAINMFLTKFRLPVKFIFCTRQCAVIMVAIYNNHNAIRVVFIYLIINNLCNDSFSVAQTIQRRMKGE